MCPVYSQLWEAVDGIFRPLCGLVASTTLCGQKRALYVHVIWILITLTISDYYIVRLLTCC